MVVSANNEVCAVQLDEAALAPGPIGAACRKSVGRGIAFKLVCVKLSFTESFFFSEKF